MLLFQSGIAQKSAKNVKELGINRFPSLDELLVQNQKPLGNNFVAMVWTDTLVYKKEVGEFESKAAAPIAGASKWLTAALVMQFVDEGKLSLDDKVNQFIPIFATYNKNYITIRHCLAGMTGIKSEPQSISAILKNKYSSLEEEVNEFAKREISNNPGVEFRYSDLGISIAGRILEIISKKKFDMLIRTKLFLPLGMRQTTFSTLDGSAPNPSTGAQSSANDYMHFLQMLLNNGMYNGQRILSEAAIKELRKTQISPEMIKFTPKQTTGMTYALGSWVMDADASGQASALTCPGLYGTWPFVDWEHHYACLIIPKALINEPNANIYLQMKDAAALTPGPPEAERAALRRLH
jgi:CubicO group peptidase (beta-lactamase class C family)